MKRINNYIIEKLKINKDSNYDDPDKKLSESDKKFLTDKIRRITYYWSDEDTNTLLNKTDSLLEKYQLVSIIDYCKTNSSKYNNIEQVLIYFTDKGNLAIYYDKHYLGAYSNLQYPITKDFLKKFNIYYEDN